MNCNTRDRFGNDGKKSMSRKWELRREMSQAVDDNQLAIVERLWRAHPELHDAYWNAPPTWLAYACLNCPLEMVELFIRLGVDINHIGKTGGPALECAIQSGRMELVNFLIANGADVNLGRPLISAILYDGAALQFVKRLIVSGISINQTYSIYGDEEDCFSALSFALMHGKQEIADFLRSHGAKTTEEILGQQPARLRSDAEADADEVIAYFEEHFGPVDPLALVEIVPEGPPITIHVVRAAKDRQCVTLFTTGMSALPMTVPTGNEAFRYAELFLQLPADWPLDAKSLATSRHGWPIQWLRSSARYPNLHQTWLGGPTTIIANGEPPEPLAPEVKFTSLFLIAERDFPRSDGETVQLYRLLPLYTEERELEIQSGLPALMLAFDALSLPFLIDIHRPNAALQPPQ